ncbi:hypothetical protein [Candidatus Pyrohabitans sp.]
MAEEVGYRSFALGVVSTLAGLLLLYQAYAEQEEAFMLAYWALGIAAMGAGLYLLLLTPGGRKQKDVAETREPGLPGECPSCGAPVTSAGKFCGSCGAPLTAREVEN